MVDRYQGVAPLVLTDARDLIVTSALSRYIQDVHELVVVLGTQQIENLSHKRAQHLVCEVFHAAATLPSNSRASTTASSESDGYVLRTMAIVSAV